MSAVAELIGAAKVYGRGWWRREDLRAVNDVSFRLEPGEILGLVGPNRAGKTTLVKLLLGLCRPSSGSVIRLGRPASDRSTLRRVGYVHESPAFPRYLSPRALLHFYGALGFVPEGVLNERVPQLLARVGLDDRADEPIARFSKGMIQRLGIAQALVNDPELLIFDEPAEGLDLPGRDMIRALLAEHRARGRSALFVSHVLGEVEQACDRLAVINSGRLVHVGPVSDLVGAAADGNRRTLEAALRELYTRTSAGPGASA